MRPGLNEGKHPEFADSPPENCSVGTSGTNWLLQ